MEEEKKRLIVISIACPLRVIFFQFYNAVTHFFFIPQYGLEMLRKISPVELIQIKHCINNVNQFGFYSKGIKK